MKTTFFYPSARRLLSAPSLATLLVEGSQGIGGNGDSFRVDIEEDDSAYRIQADLPGVKKDAVAINVEDDVLTISAEFSRGAGGNSESADKPLRRERINGKVSRQFVLSPDVNAEQIDAALDNGVLTLTLPKGEDKRRRTIAVA